MHTRGEEEEMSTTSVECLFSNHPPASAPTLSPAASAA